MCPKSREPHEFSVKAQICDLQIVAQHMHLKLRVAKAHLFVKLMGTLLLKEQDAQAKQHKHA